MNVNEKLLNKEISHAIDVLGYSNAVTKKIIQILNSADASLYSKLTAELNKVTPSPEKLSRIKALLRSVNDLNASAYTKVSDKLKSDLRKFAGSEVEYQQNLIGSVQPVKVLPISPEAAYASAVATPFQGKFLSEFLTGMETQKANLIRDAVRIGFIESQTTSEIVDKIRGTKALNYTDGIMNITRANAESVVLTAIAHTANVAQQALYDANEDIIKGYRYTATLDTRTTELCASRDGNYYPLGEPKPSIPAHFRCRSRYVAVIKSFKELGLDVDLPESTRASMDGQVPAKTTYQEWLKNQSVDRQNEVLGVTKAQLFRDGKLTLDKFVSPTGHVYSLDELKQRNAKAFESVQVVQAINEPVQLTWKKDTPQARFHDASFADAPDYMVNAIVKYDDQLKGVTEKKGGVYYSSSKTIENPAPDSIKNQGTWRHEYGHFLDNVLSDGKQTYRSSQKDFDDILKAETAEILINAGFGRRSKSQIDFNVKRQAEIKALQQEMANMDILEADKFVTAKAKEIGFNLDNLDKFFRQETTYIDSDTTTMYRKALMLDAIKNKDVSSFMVSLNGIDDRANYRKGNIGKFSDLVGSATRNKLLGWGTNGNGGHSNAYYRARSDRANTEVFANLTALYGSPNKFWSDVVDVFYPQTGKLYKGILND
jgi:SPP1 gp7 family putative phage head morphogenesis protein